MPSPSPSQPALSRSDFPLSPWLLRVPPNALTLLLAGPAVGKTALCGTLARAYLAEHQPDLWPSHDAINVALLPDPVAYADPLLTRLSARPDPRTENRLMAFRLPDYRALAKGATLDGGPDTRTPQQREQEMKYFQKLSFGSDLAVALSFALTTLPKDPLAVIIDSLDRYIPRTLGLMSNNYLHRMLPGLATVAAEAKITLIATITLPHDHPSAATPILKEASPAASVLLLTRDPQTPSQRLLLSLRTPAPTMPPPVALTLGHGFAELLPSLPDSSPLPIDPLANHGLHLPTDFTARWLLSQLTAAGGSAHVDDLLLRADQAHIPPRTLYTAKARLGLVSTRTGFGPSMKSKWSLPEMRAPKAPSTPAAATAPATTLAA